MIRGTLSLLFFIMAAAPVFAVNPDEKLADPTLESRARGLSAKLRCLVCQNQSIDDSNADLARDLRLLVREKLSDGFTDDQVLTYVISRYGQFVLLKPPLSTETLLLWGAPLLLAAAGATSLGVAVRRNRGRSGDLRLTAEEQARLAEVVED